MTKTTSRTAPRAKATAMREDEIPDGRDGLTRRERLVLVTLGRLQKERDGRNVPLPMLYGAVLEQLDMSVPELQAIVERLGARR